MEITKDFLCGNIEIVKQDGDEFLLQPETRGDTGYFYWLFRIDGAQGRKAAHLNSDAAFLKPRFQAEFLTDNRKRTKKQNSRGEIT